MKRYVFKYTPEPTKTGIIQRPTARVSMQSTNSEWYTFRVYVDSGADMSLFRKSDAKLLGLDLYAGEYHPMMGIGKTLIPAYKHKVKLRIEDTILTALVSFADSDEVPRLLGRTDIFKHFKISFVETALEIIFESAESPEYEKIIPTEKPTREEKRAMEQKDEVAEEDELMKKLS